MNLINHFVFAETSIADVSLGYREEVVASGVPMWIYAAVAIAFIAIGAAVYAWINRTPTILNTPLGMLHELCKAHRVNRRGRRLLEQMAEAASLDHPAILFAGPEHLESCIKQTQGRIDYKTEHASTLGVLRRKLYG